jgi:predicted nucleic acid-binding protein
MGLVVDASVALCWFVESPGTDRARSLLRSGEVLVAPELVIAEITNAAWKSVIREEISTESATAIVREASRFFIELVPAIALQARAISIALELRHPAYDCFYLALADIRDIQVVTSDNRLLSRCANTRYASLVRAL